MASGCDNPLCLSAPSDRPGRRFRHAQPSYHRALSLAVLIAAAVLSACSSAPMIDSLPSAVGEPAGAPKRAGVAPAFPAIHDVPSPRSAATLNAEEQKKAETELIAARESQRTGTIPPPPVVAAKAKPAASPAATASKKPHNPAVTREAAAGNGQNP
jgi:hypothetical protein